MNVRTKPIDSVVLEDPSSDRVGFLRLSQGKGSLIVLGIFLALLMGALDQLVVLTALPNIATSLGQSNGVAFVVSSYLIASVIGIPIFGRLADMFSRRDVFLAGLVTFVVGSALAGLSQNFGELIAFRAVQGFSSDTFLIVGFVIVAVIFPPEDRARVTGLFTAVAGIGIVAGPLLGSYIVDHATWRWVFFINIPIAVVAFLVLLFTLDRLLPERQSRFDFGGAALLFGWVTTLMLALVQNSESGWAWTDTRIVALLTSACVLLVAFLLWEFRTEDSLVPLQFFRRRNIAAAGGVSVLRGAALYSLLTFITIYVGLILLHGAADAADTVRDVLYWFVIPVILGAGVGSQLLTRVGYRAVTAGGAALAVLGTFFLTQVSASTPKWQFTYGFLPTGGLILPLVPGGFGIGMTLTAAILAAQFSVSQKEVGAATAIMQFLNLLGGAVAASLLSSFQQERVAILSPSPPSLSCVNGQTPLSVCGPYFQAVQSAGVTSIQEIFMVTFALVVVALLASLFMTGRLPKRQPSML